ncbi:MAG: htpX [Solirubrobacteraceae bacterium]|nr:htpX [Solirubrobacteraceae bacterium]
MARPSSFGRDTGLQTRMLLTMFLLGLVYVIFVGVLFAAGASAVIIILVAGGLFIAQLFASDKLALRAMGAKEVTPAEAPELHSMIDRLCVQADLPKPKLAVADTQMPNAFAMGRSQKSATVCATTGLMQLLSPTELEGVLAHELTHIINRDVVIMTVASFFASIASMITQFGFFFGGGFGGGMGDGDNDDGPSWLAVILISMIVYVISFLLMQALSRYREFAADRGSAVITGRPSGLASALLKISGINERIPSQDLREVSQMQAFFIAPVGQQVANLLATHPPLEQRIARLSRLEAQLQGSALPSAA